MAKAVVFDLGKVLVDFDYSIAVRRLAADCKLRPQEIGDFLLHTPLLVRYETGQLTSEQFFGEIAAATGYRGNFEQFSNSFSDIFTPIQPMIDLHRELKSTGNPTYIFSNTNDLAVSHIRRVFPFFGGFDGYILSYEHGVMKPDPGLYAVVERVCGRSGPDILYLDDRAENIATGAARGWNVVLQETPEKSRAALRKFGLLKPQAGGDPGFELSSASIR